MPTPTIGQTLPRADEAYTAPEKLDWILAERGHGREWTRVLRIRSDDTERFWDAIAQAVFDAPIFKVVDREPDGVVCGVETILVVGERSVKTRLFWHYKHADDAPRLVTAYPRP
jgi:hypothetical protein